MNFDKYEHNLPRKDLEKYYEKSDELIAQQPNTYLNIIDETIEGSRDFLLQRNPKNNDATLAEDIALGLIKGTINYDMLNIESPDQKILEETIESLKIKSDRLEDLDKQYSKEIIEINEKAKGIDMQYEEKMAQYKSMENLGYNVKDVQNLNLLNLKKEILTLQKQKEEHLQQIVALQKKKNDGSAKKMYVDEMHTTLEMENPKNQQRLEEQN